MGRILSWLAALIAVEVTLALLGAADAAESDVSLSFRPGFNLLSYPVEVPQGLVCDDVKGLLGALDMRRLDSQTQVFETCSPGDTGFPITAGEGFAVMTETVGELSFRGEPGCPEIDLHAGLNIVGVPTPPGGLSCYKLLAAMGGSATVATITRFDGVSGRFESCALEAGAQTEAEPMGKDYPIVAGAGYLVSMRRAISSFAPNDPGRCPFSTLSLAIYDFTPRQGPMGTAVTILGVGFDPEPLNNILDFNGAPASVASATVTTLVATVPVGATTGPISVTLGQDFASSSQDFRVTLDPIVTSVSTGYALPGTLVPELRITGFNMANASFDFEPASVPPAIRVDSAAIGTAGQSATLALTVGTERTGRFALVATSAEGRSSGVATDANSFFVLDPDADEDNDGLTNAEEIAQGTDPLTHDSDGDGFNDKEEIEDGSDPRDSDSLPPSVLLGSGKAFGAAVSLFNARVPSGETGHAAGASFSVFNAKDPGRETWHLAGASFSVFNRQDPGDPIGYTAGASLSVENVGQP